MLEKSSASASSPVQLFFFVQTKNRAGGSTANYKAMTVGARAIDTNTSTFGAGADDWHFFYWYIRGNHSWLWAYNETSGLLDTFYADASAYGGIEDSQSWPLRIGSHINSEPLEQRLGTAGIGGHYLIDNVGFDCKAPTYGSTSVPIPAPPPSHVTALYNSGTGSACPNNGV